MTYEKTLEQYMQFVDSFIRRQKEISKLDKIVRISFGEDVPSFMISDIAMNTDKSMNEEFIEIGKGVLKGAMDCGKLPHDKPRYWTATRFLEHYGLLMYVEKDLSEFEKKRVRMDDLLAREPNFLIDDSLIERLNREP